MRPITTLAEALAALHDRSGYERGFISNPFAGDEAARLGLRRTQAMLDRLGNPERSMAIVHVAGSKGKGSTSVFASGMLRASGRTTGLYTSPHLHRWHERFVVNGDAIDDEAFVTLTRDGIATAEAVERDTPELSVVTAFEMTTAMALLHFARSGCDAAVIEVGMGGTLDATNVVSPAVSVITLLDYEHTAVLGPTLADIASNKAGIIKRGRPVVSAEQQPEARDVIIARAAEMDAPLMIAGQHWRTSGTAHTFEVTGPWGRFTDLALAMPGTHQVSNAALAIAAVWHVVPGLSETAVRSGLREARLPGRFEQSALPTGQDVVLDGAHTPASARALATALHTTFRDRPIVMLIGMLEDKDPDAVIAPLRAIADHWITVTPDSPRAIRSTALARSIDADGNAVTACGDVREGIARAAECDRDSVIVVTGSFSTVADARVALDLA